MIEKDILIIGAGPSGAVAAAYLSDKNLDVLVIEKTIFPRFVIGESLLPQCMDYLKEVGLTDYIEKCDYQKKYGAIFSNEGKAIDFLFNEKSSEGWDWTWQVPREDFDTVLINGVIDKGVEVLFESSVETIEDSSDYKIVLCKDKEGNEFKVKTKFIIDGSGYGRVLPKLYDLNQPSELTPRSSIFARINDDSKNKEETDNIVIHSIENNNAWLWSIPFSDGNTSVGIVGEIPYVTDLAANDSEKFKTLLKEASFLNGRYSKSHYVLEPDVIHGFSIGIKKMHGDGFVLCGNTTEFLDPIFSSGVTLACGSGLLAAKLAEKQLKGESVDWDAEYDQVINKGIAVFRTYIDAWYDGSLHKVFFAEHIDIKIKAQICSVLAGFVWDESNPFVKDHNSKLKTLTKVIEIQSQV